MLRIFKLAVCLAAVFALAGGLRANLADEIVQKHLARGGEQAKALHSLRGEGKTFIGREVVPFVFVSQRPNKLRVESYSPSRRVVQIYDGVNPPWNSHTNVKGGMPDNMSEDDAKEFIENADFDGPLANSAGKGYSIDYAGEEEVEGRRAYKLLVMNKSDRIFFLWVDAEHHEIVKRTVFRSSNGKRVAVDTIFKNFRPVAGVLQPHRVDTLVDGRLAYIMMTDKMEANPANLNEDTFKRLDIRP